MTTKAKHTRFTVVGVGDGDDPENFTPIAEVKSFNGPNGKAGTIDVSSFDSVKKEKIAALADAGQLSFEMNFIGTDSMQQQLRADLKDGTKRNYQIIFNDAPDDDGTPTSVVFEAFVTELTPKGDTDAAYMMSCTLEITGDDEWEFAAEGA